RRASASDARRPRRLRRARFLLKAKRDARVSKFLTEARVVRRSTAALAAGSCCLVFAVTSSVYAQPAHDSQTASAVADITARLGSGDPQRVAWGAYFAAQNNLTTMVPVLSSALVTTPGADPWVLDALIQLHARLPAAQLTATYDRWPVQSLILL